MPHACDTHFRTCFTNFLMKNYACTIYIYVCAYEVSRSLYACMICVCHNNSCNNPFCSCWCYVYTVCVNKAFSKWKHSVYSTTCTQLTTHIHAYIINIHTYTCPHSHIDMLLNIDIHFVLAYDIHLPLYNISVSLIYFVNPTCICVCVYGCVG